MGRQLGLILSPLSHALGCSLTVAVLIDLSCRLKRGSEDLPEMRRRV